jgi:hypothetical protein
MFDTVDMGAYESQSPAGLMIYVDKNATGAGDGTSWADAYTELRDALDGLLCPQADIWVAQGTYTPTDGLDRAETFEMLSGVAIYGGFDGTETALSERDVASNTTILSGDIGVAMDSADNSVNVVTSNGNDSTAVLDGFTVTKGNGSLGGGIISANGSPTISSVIFTGNTAEDFGGAMYNAFNSSPTLVNVVFTHNDAEDGGAVSNANSSHPRFINVTFSSNTATGTGGAMDNALFSSPTIINSILWGNTAPMGAQINNDGLSNPILSHCDIQGSGGSDAWDTNVGVDGGNNIDSNPLFLDGANGNVRINPGSPVIDEGNTSALPVGVTTDLDGNARVTGGAVDTGAFEFQSAPTLFAFPGPVGAGSACDTIKLVNVGGSTLNISSITGCDTPPFGIDTSMTAHTLLPGDTTDIVVCLVPPAIADSCTITVTSDASNSPTDILVTVNVITGIATENVPGQFRILSVAPNPFNPTTTVRFTLPRAMPVTTEIFSVSGARVRVLTNGRVFGPGNNQVTWDGRNDQGSPAASGVYFVKVRTELGARMTRAVLLK